MCGRYTAAKDFGELIKLVGVVMARVPFFAPRYNIAPTQMAEPLKIYPVSDLVNSPKTDDTRCIKPVRIERDMFERQWWGEG